MPLYEYQCVKCRRITEKSRKIIQRNLSLRCPCGSKAKLVSSSFSIGHVQATVPERTPPSERIPLVQLDPGSGPTYFDNCDFTGGPNQDAIHLKDSAIIGNNIRISGVGRGIVSENSEVSINKLKIE